MATYTDRRAVPDLVFRVGETRRIEHIISSDTAFSVSGTTCTIRDSAGTAVVTAGAGSQDSGSGTEKRAWYVWATTGRTAGAYTYQISYTIGAETLFATGSLTLLPATSKLDSYVQRTVRYVAEAATSDDQQAVSEAGYREAVADAVRAFSLARPRRLQASVSMVANTFEYALPSGWVNEFSTIQTLEYPVDDTLITKYYLDTDEYKVDEIRAKWRFTEITPASGETARVQYTVPYTLTDSSDTLPTDRFESLCMYAAGLVLMQLSNRAAGTSEPQVGAQVAGYRSKQAEYRKQAEGWLKLATSQWGGTRSATLGGLAM